MHWLRQQKANYKQLAVSERPTIDANSHSRASHGALTV